MSCNESECVCVCACVHACVSVCVCVVVPLRCVFLGVHVYTFTTECVLVHVMFVFTIYFSFCDFLWTIPVQCLCAYRELPLQVV